MMLIPPMLIPSARTSACTFLAPGLLLLALSGPGYAAEAVTPGVGPGAATAEGPAAPAVETAVVTVEQLLQQLPKTSSIVQQDDKLWWDDGKGARLAIALVECGQGNPTLETAIGRLAVDRRLMADDHVAVVAKVGPLVAVAKAAGVKADGFTVREGILTGIHLRADAQLVLPEGVLTKVDTSAPTRTAEREALEAAVQGALAALPTSKLDDLGRKTVTDVLGRVDAEDGKQAVDEVAPSFARRVVRFGWLKQALQGEIDSKPLITAINAANAFAPATRFSGKTAEGKELLLAEVKNSFGQGGWILRTPLHSSFTRLQVEPIYYWAMQPMNLVVDLPPGADPATFPDVGVEPIGARLYRNGQVIISWTRDGAFTVDKALWRDAVPDERGKPGVDKNATADFMPPHIAITGFDGDVAGIATDGGWLKAPTGDTQDAERFLRDAARQLPDSGHLDLIGEYLLTYVYDSPDSRFPFLIGNKQVKGDIHQTAIQTLSTATGGQVRGDCDDLAELYQTICLRQGRTAIVLSLPQHAANAWAEKGSDGRWHVFVLQTGPALEFTDPKLQKALEAAYKSFGASESFDPNGLGLLLRFSGENTRSSWRLSYRIFAEPDYAKTMIDVQKDWHFQTYQRGINTMKGLIAKGDQDTANFRELSGLYSFTGQYAEAAEQHRIALARTEEADSKFYMQAELLGHLFDAKQADQAKALAKDLIEVQFPALKEKLGPGAWSAGMELVGILNRHESVALSEQALEAFLLEPLSAQAGSLQDKLTQLAGYVQSAKFNQQVWENSGQMMELRNLTAQFAGTCLGVLHEAGAEHLDTDAVLQAAARNTELWLTHLAFHDVDEPGEAPTRYASAGRYYAAILGQERFDQLLAGAAMPTDASADHTHRIGGLAQLPIDLPWIKASVPYWSGRLMELFGRDNQTLDKAEVARLGKAIAAANEVSTKLGIDSPQLEQANHLSRLIVALITQDDKTVRACLQLVKEKNDKRLRDDTAQWIGDCGRFMAIDWFGKVVAMWDEDPKPNKAKYFWIAWRAALGGAKQQALLAAKVAVDRFKDDESFAEEYEFMRKLYEPPVAPK